jgi:aminoglycoside/choline kinase family phosphotransferase
MPTDAILTATRQYLGVDPSVSVLLVPIKRGASGRTIVRLKPEGRPSLIGIYYTNDREDNASFVAVAEFLRKARLNVPEILYSNPHKRVILVEDLGDVDLLSLKGQPWDARAPFYASALAQIDRLFYTRPPKELHLQPPFDAKLYAWEQSYFLDYLVETHLGRGVRGVIDAAPLVALRERLGASARHLIHRDFQSQNLMVHQEKTWLIDFQGLRYGRQEYDLASLLFDPYMAHSAAEREGILGLWEELADERPDPGILRDCAIQRLMQALGAYANIVHLRGDESYRQFIPVAAGSLRELVTGTDLEGVLAGYLEEAITSVSC